MEFSTLLSSGSQKKKRMMTKHENTGTISRPPQGWENSINIEALPGKVVAFAKEEDGKETKGGLLIPDRVIALKMHSEVPPFDLTPIWIISSGIKELRPGDLAFAMPLDGQWWRSDERPGIPDGWQLRLYGAHGEVLTQIPCKAL